ncbi:Lrp/AsnC family transcriptional regulator [Synechococcus sp. PCC 7336]|uniref:Lrp/AsnC family transcriptional regulator n=1 Tax=Synechococcus sp. PCC 7336 TaxID=195250 RepID=UPI000476DBA6|nr:AsnC family transcriptional regulator [Synechococcus sp. PCC 7336]
MTQPGNLSSSVNQLDSVDREIVALLRIDGRMSFSEIAKRLKIPEATARYRVQRLLQSGTIEISAWPNPDKLGKPHILIVSISVEIQYIDEVAEQLSNMSEIRYVAVITGKYNIMVDVFFGPHEELLVFFEKLHLIPGIINYESQVLIKLLKAEYKYIL